MRFITEDTNKGDVKDPLSLNLYTYCQGNPIKYYDYSGNNPMIQKYAGEYHFTHTSKEEEVIWALTGVIPFSSIANYISRRIVGPLLGLEMIEGNDLGNGQGIFADLVSNSQFFTKSISKDIVASAGILSFLFTARDIREISKADDSIDIFLSSIFEDCMRSKSKDALVAKYMYAKLVLGKLRDNGIITMTMNENGSIDYGDPNGVLDKLEEELYNMES